MRIYLHDVPSNLFPVDECLVKISHSQNGQITRSVFANPKNNQIGFLIKRNNESRDVAKRKIWGVQEKFFQNFRVY
jgi:hypothetical protein